MFNLLAEGANPGSYIFLLIIFGAMLLFMFMSNRSQKKKQQEILDMRAGIQPGDKVTTIGGIIGVVVEVSAEENSFVLETGMKGNKCRIKFDKQAIYQTESAKKAEEATKAPVEEKKEEVVEEKETTEETTDNE